MLDSLRAMAPARRAFWLGLLAIALVVGVVVAVTSLGGREADVEPVAQDEPGPVLLVPGYGGNTDGLRVMADALVDQGREARVVPPRGSGTGDLAEQASDLATVVDDVLEETGAPSVDLVGYSAGGVVVRLYVADLGGGSTVRRAVTLASPHHGTELAALGATVGGSACPEACRQLDPDSELLRDLNADDETPAGPAWVALWTEDDATVVPPTSGSLEGALDLSLQSLCPGLEVGHPQVPTDPTVIAVVLAATAVDEPAAPEGCVSS